MPNLGEPASIAHLFSFMRDRCQIKFIVSLPELTDSPFYLQLLSIQADNIVDRNMNQRLRNRVNESIGRMY